MLSVCSFGKFQLDAYAAAEASPFNVQNRPLGGRGSGRLGGPGPGSGPGTGGGSAGPGRRLGLVDDIRGPECKSCG